MHYLLRGSIERGAELWSPNEEEYEMLKAAVVGGPSLVFTRRHVAGVTRIRPHRIMNHTLCRKILGYDANALYLSTKLNDMPCGKGEVVRYEEEAVAPNFVKKLKEGEWSGFAEVDIQIPRALWAKFEEMPPFFFNKELPDRAVPQQVWNYLQKTGRKKSKMQETGGRPLCREDVGLRSSAALVC